MGIKVVSMFWLLLALLLWTPVYMYLCLQFVGYILINGVARSKVWILKAMAFPQSFESWTIKKAKCQRIHAFELWCWRRLLRITKTARRSNQPILKEISPEYSLEERADAEAETAIIFPPDAKNWLIGKDPDARKDRKQEEKGTTDDKMVGWHCWLNGHEFEQILGDSEGQGSLACCSQWGYRELGIT